MLSWVLSLSLYFITIITGLFLDSDAFSHGFKRLSPKTKYTIKQVYLIWLYIFLCFGYMTGADWRNYEMTYNYGDGILRFITEPASWFVFTFFPKIIPDFVLLMGLAKCLYLYSAYKLALTITDKWVSVLAFLIPCQLGFMLIQNPFRFMLASVFINFAFYQLYLYFKTPRKHNTKTVLVVMALSIIAILFHTSCVVYLLLFPLSFLAPKIKKTRPWILIAIYLFIIFISSDLSFINNLKENAISFVQRYMEMSDYASYVREDNASIWSIGNLLRILFFLFFLSSRTAICQRYENGDIVYGLAILYFYLSRLLILIPTGFRLSLPFSIFYVIFIIYMLNAKGKRRPMLVEIQKGASLSSKDRPPLHPVKSIPRFPVKFCAQLMIIYTLLSFGKKAWNTYDMIPYSNSIPYLIFGHLSYDERSQYNLDAYEKRFGVPFEMRDE